MSLISKITNLWAASGTKTNPGTTKIDLGWIGGEKPPAEYFNYLLNRDQGKIDETIDALNSIYENNPASPVLNGDIELAGTNTMSGTMELESGDPTTGYFSSDNVLATSFHKTFESAPHATYSTRIRHFSTVDDDVVTVNCDFNWASGYWVPDNTGRPAYKIVTCQESGSPIHYIKYSTTPANWIDSAWDAGVQDHSYQTGGLISAQPRLVIGEQWKMTYTVCWDDTNHYSSNANITKCIFIPWGAQISGSISTTIGGANLSYTSLGSTGGGWTVAGAATSAGSYGCVVEATTAVALAPTARALEYGNFSIVG